MVVSILRPSFAAAYHIARRTLSGFAPSSGHSWTSPGLDPRRASHGYSRAAVGRDAPLVLRRIARSSSSTRGAIRWRLTAARRRLRRPRTAANGCRISPGRRGVPRRRVLRSNAHPGGRRRANSMIEASSTSRWWRSCSSRSRPRGCTNATFFPADIVTILYAFSVPKRRLMSVCMIAASPVSYSPLLFGVNEAVLPLDALLVAVVLEGTARAGCRAASRGRGVGRPLLWVGARPEWDVMLLHVGQGPLPAHVPSRGWPRAGQRPGWTGTARCGHCLSGAGARSGARGGLAGEARGWAG